MQGLDRTSRRPPSFHEMDRRKMQVAVEKIFGDYHYYKLIDFEPEEVSTTASYSDIPRSITNVTSDSTGNIATRNVDELEFRRKFVETVEKSIERLPVIEREIVEKRYMTNDHAYIKDWQVYSLLLKPTISKDLYMKYRAKAFYNLAKIYDFHRMLAMNELTKNESKELDNTAN